MTQASAGPRIRLAPVGEPGAALFNAYNYLTLLSTLYAQVLKHEQRPEDQAIWRELCDQALNDLGEIYSVWEAVLKSERASKGAPPDRDTAALGEVVARACRRAEAIMERANVWTPLLRWANLLRLAEARWQRILARIQKTSPYVGPRLVSALNSSQSRTSRLTAIVESARLAKGRVDGSFNPDGGSFGGTVGF